MLSDLLSLEKYFGVYEAVLFDDDIIEKYGRFVLNRAFDAGYIETRVICIGPDCGRRLCWLSDKGRKAAQKVL